MSKLILEIEDTRPIIHEVILSADQSDPNKPQILIDIQSSAEVKSMFVYHPLVLDKEEAKVLVKYLKTIFNL